MDIFRGLSFLLFGHFFPTGFPGPWKIHSSLAGQKVRNMISLQGSTISLLSMTNFCLKKNFMCLHMSGPISNN